MLSHKRYDFRDMIIEHKMFITVLPRSPTKGQKMNECFTCERGLYSTGQAANDYDLRVKSEGKHRDHMQARLFVPGRNSVPMSHKQYDELHS